MTGITVGTAALVGAALGWWGAAVVALVAILTQIVWSKNAVAAGCAVAVIAAGLGAWRADGLRPADAFFGTSHGRMSARVVTLPVQTGARQQFVVTPQGAQALAPTTRICVSSDPDPIVRVGDFLALNGEIQGAADQSMAFRAALLARDCVATMRTDSVQIIDSSPGPKRALGELRARLGTILRGAAPGDTGVLLAGLVTGVKTTISPPSVGTRSFGPAPRTSLRSAAPTWHSSRACSPPLGPRLLAVIVHRGKSLRLSACGGMPWFRARTPLP